jgi:hypothetical protein
MALDSESYAQRQHGRMNRILTAWRALRHGMILLLLLVLSACTVLVPDEGEPPATWMPLPTVAPFATDTPQPSPTASPTPIATSTATATPLERQPTLAQDKVDGLLGIVRSLPDTAGFDDYFSELRQNVQWGIAPANEAVEGEIGQARDSGRAVRVWGGIERDVDDYGGARIVVERIEFTDPPPSLSPEETLVATPTLEVVASPATTPETLSPTATLKAQSEITPTPRPQTVIVEGWLGMIRPLPSGSAYDYEHYFAARDREGQYGITSTLPPVEEQLRQYRDSGALVRIWGILEVGVDDYGGARIYVTRIEAVD